MTAPVAQVVYRGADGSAHALLSTATGSELIIADPKVGMFPIHFEGPCRLVSSNDDSVIYESITARESTRVYVSLGQEPFMHTLGGVCTDCAFPSVERLGLGHDFELWPVCPRGERAGSASAGSVVRPKTPKDLADRLALNRIASLASDILVCLLKPGRGVYDSDSDHGHPGGEGQALERHASTPEQCRRFCNSPSSDGQTPYNWRLDIPGSS